MSEKLAPWDKLDRAKCSKLPCAVLGNELQLCRFHGSAEKLFDSLNLVDVAFQQGVIIAGDADRTLGLWSLIRETLAEARK